MKIAILGGTGEQGFGLALRFAKNHEVIIGSRKKEKAEDAAEKVKSILKERGIDANVTGLENKDAAKEGDVVILSLPYEYTISTIKDLKDVLDGKIVVSIGVPLATTIGDKATRPLLPPQGSVAEMVQEKLKNSKVVSAFQNVSSKALEDLDNPVECDVLVCGDDEEAKKVVMELAEEIEGVRAIDCGELEMSRIIEQITPLLIKLNIKHKLKGAGIRITGI
jgi:NADPH-dependent F420 reductase